MGQASNPVIEKYLEELSQLSTSDQLALVAEVTARLSQQHEHSPTSEGSSGRTSSSVEGAAVITDNVEIDKYIEGRKPNSVAHLAGSWPEDSPPEMPTAWGAPYTAVEMVEKIYGARVSKADVPAW